MTVTFNAPRLQTQRLILRAPNLSDFEAYAAFYATDRARFVGGPLDRGDTWQMLAADAAFAKMAQDESVPAAFAFYAAEDVWMFPEGGQPYQGRSTLIERFAGWPLPVRVCRWSLKGVLQMQLPISMVR